MLNNMPTGIMTAPTQTKKVSNTPSPRNTSFPKIVGLFLPFVSLWNYLAHKKLTPLATAPLSPTEMDCILPMECLSLSINLPLNKPAFTLPPWLLKSFLHEAKDAYLEAPPGTSWRPELWPSFHFPAIQSVLSKGREVHGGRSGLCFTFRALLRHMVNLSVICCSPLFW